MPSSLRDWLDSKNKLRFPIKFYIYILIFLYLFIPFTASSSEFVPMFDISSPLVINKRPAGSIRVGIGVDDLYMIDALEASKILTEYMEDASIITFLNIEEMPTTQKWLPIEKLNEDIAEISFDKADLSLSLRINPEYRKKGTFPIREITRTSAGDPLDETVFSIFMNSSLDSNLDINVETDTPTSYSLPFRLSAKPVINLYGSTVSTDILYTNSYRFNQKDFITDNLPVFSNTSFVYDFPKEPILFQAGNLSYALQPFQSRTASKGIVLKKELKYGADTASSYFKGQSPVLPILLEEDAYVTVIINGNSVKRTYLYAGPYTITALPLTNGINTVTIKKETQTGTFEDHYSFGYASGLVPAEKSKFSLGIGASKWSEYDSPVVFLNQSLGIRYNLTLGYFGEITVGKQVLGLNGIYASRFGNINLSTAVRFTEALTPGFSSEFNYSYFPITNREFGNFNLKGTYQTEKFGLISTDIPDNNTMATLSSSYSRSFFDLFGLSLNSNFTFPHNFSDPVTASLSAGSSIYPFEELSLTGRLRLGWDNEFTFTTEPQLSGSLFATLRPKNSDFYFSASTDGSSISFQANWDPKNKNSITPNLQFQTSGISVDDPVPDTMSLKSQFKNQFANWGVNQRVSKDSGGQFDSTTEFSAHSSLVFTDGTFALSRPVNNGFVMVKPEDNFKDVKLLVNPTNTGIQTTTKKNLAAIVPNISSFRNNSISIQAEELEAGYQLGNDRFTFNPSYSGAAVIRVGDSGKPPVSLTGRFVKPDWSPLVYASGKVYLKDGQTVEDDLFLFTDDTGYFEIHGLTAGTYEFMMFNPEQRSYRVTIPEGTEGQHSLGTLRFGGTPLIADFPPLGSTAQLANLSRRLNDAKLLTDKNYESPDNFRRNNSLTVLGSSAYNVDFSNYRNSLGPVTLKGSILDELDKPITGVHGTVYSMNGSPLNYEITFSTNQDGTFTLWGLASGVYTFSLTVPDSDIKKYYRLSIPEKIYGVKDIDAIRINLSEKRQNSKEGKSEAADSRMNRLPSTRVDIQGTFIEDNGIPTSNAYGYVFQFNEALTNKNIRFYTDIEGNFILSGMFPGTYRMSLFGSVQKDFRIIIPEEVSSGIKDIGSIIYEPTGPSLVPEIQDNEKTQKYKVITQEE